MKLSVIIPAYNEEKYLGATLKAINLALQSSADISELIVVDNESNDKTAEIAKNLGARVVSELVHNIAKVGNTGAAAACGDVLIFIDADTLVPHGLFNAIADVMQNRMCFGGAVAVDYDKFQRKWMKYYLAGWEFWGRLFNMKQGAAQFCSPQAFRDLNGYDEGIFMGEDIEFYWRLSKWTKSRGGFLNFIEDIRVTTSARRFDKMSMLKTILLTHPLIIWMNWKRKSFWKDWYDHPVR